MMTRFKKVKYPKLLLLIFSFLIAYKIFEEGSIDGFHSFIVSIGYFGTFVAGFFYAYGFTAAPATAFLLLLAQEQNILIAGLVGGLGAVISDSLIFLFIRNTVMDEIKKISRTKPVRFFKKGQKRVFGKFKKYVLPVFSGFLIASPLPTEVGVSLLASSKNICLKRFLVIAFCLHSLGILIILSIGKII